MANADKKFDEYFQKKLGNHEVKPSGLAWERLDQKLSEQNNNVGFPYLKIAATVVLLLSAGYVFYTMDFARIEESRQIAVKEEGVVQDKKEDIAPEIMPDPKMIVKEDKNQIDLIYSETNPVASRANNKVQTEETQTQELLAEAKNPIEIILTEKIDLPEITLPELDLRESIALSEDIEDKEEEISYKVTIISRGIKEEPVKQNLLEEIEEKVDKIGGLFSKVEQGFADLQDAKNNLFANSNPRKERTR